jgi:hypothetical protein
MAARAWPASAKASLRARPSLPRSRCPASLVEAHITDDKRSFINAEVDSILEASPLPNDAQLPLLRYLRRMQLPARGVYAHQVEIKTAILTRGARARTAIESFLTLRREPPSLELSQPHSPPCSGVSIRALLSRTPLSNQLLAVDKCPIAARLLEKAIVTVTEWRIARLGRVCNEIEFFAADEVRCSSLFSQERAIDRRKAKLLTMCLALKQNYRSSQGGHSSWRS